MPPPATRARPDQGGDRASTWRHASELFQVEGVLPGRRPAIEGDWGYRFFVILDGTAVVRIGDEEVNTLGPGDFFGELALLGEEGKRQAEVEATTRMRYASMMVWDFRKLLQEQPAIGTKTKTAIEQYRATGEAE